VDLSQGVTLRAQVIFVRRPGWLHFASDKRRRQGYLLRRPNDANWGGDERRHPVQYNNAALIKHEFELDASRLEQASDRGCAERTADFLVVTVSQVYCPIWSKPARHHSLKASDAKLVEVEGLCDTGAKTQGRGDAKSGEGHSEPVCDQLLNRFELGSQHGLDVCGAAPIDEAVFRYNTTEGRVCPEGGVGLVCRHLSKSASLGFCYTNLAIEIVAMVQHLAHQGAADAWNDKQAACEFTLVRGN